MHWKNISARRSKLKSWWRPKDVTLWTSFRDALRTSTGRLSKTVRICGITFPNFARHIWWSKIENNTSAMIKICDTSIWRPLKLIFQSCLESGKFSIEWKKTNVVPVHKKGDKQILKHYRPISLLPIFGKTFKRLLYDRIFEIFIENNLTSIK